MNTNDLVAGLDPTAFTTITGAQILTAIDDAQPSSDRGFVLVTTDSGLNLPNVPDARPNTGNTIFQRYIWIRVQPATATVTTYVWNPNGNTDATFLNWITVSQTSYTANSIPGYALISVPSSIISGTIPYSQITGIPPVATVSSTALTADGLINSSMFSQISFVWGCLAGHAGTPGTPVLAPLSVTTGTIAAQVISGNYTPATGNIIDRTITNIQLSTQNTGQGLWYSAATINSGIHAQTLNCVDPLNNISVPALSGQGPVYTPATILSTAGPVLAGDILAVNSTKTGYVTVNRAILNLPEPTVANQVPISTGAGVYTLNAGANTSAFGKVLQVVEVRSTTSSFLAGSATATQIINTALPQFNISAGAVSPVSTKTGFVLDGTTSGSAKIPLGLSITPISSSSKLRIRLSIPLMNAAGTRIAAAIYSINPANITSIVSGVVTYTGSVGPLNPIVDAATGYTVGIKSAYGGNSYENVYEFEWLITPSFAYGTTPYAAGTVMNLVVCVGSTGADAIGINSTSTSAATPIFVAGAIASVLSVEEIIA
jgi:hypothetical protein